MTRFYSGIGSRQTPARVLDRCTKFAVALEKLGFTLRSGGADGADKAFEAGVSNSCNKIIFRPKHSTKAAEEMASRIHPFWGNCNDYVKKLHGRNMQIVLGENLDTPSEFILAWTFDGQLIGGTRTGLVAGIRNKVPIYNLGRQDQFWSFVSFLKGLYVEADKKS